MKENGQDSLTKALMSPDSGAGRVNKTQDSLATSAFTDAKQDQKEATYNKSFLAFLVSISTIGGFLFGYDTSVIGGAQIYFVNDWPDITDTQIATVVSITMLGAAIGALFSGVTSDHYGRKPVIMIADVLFTVGSVAMGFAPTIWCLMIGRFILGLGVGVASQIVPLYLSEVAPIEIRGQLVAFNVLVITFAQLLSAGISFALRPHWRWMLGGIAFMSIGQFVGMFFMPESPRWLGKAGKIEEMTAVMRRLYKPQFLEAANASLQCEIDTLKESCQLSQCERLKTLYNCYGRCMFIGISLLIFQQLDGINTAMYYGPLMMKNAGIKVPGLSDDESSLVLNIPLAGANFIGTIFCVLYIEKMGRKGVLLRTTPILAVCWVFAATGMAFTGEDRSETSQAVGGYIAITFILLYIFVFAIGMGPIPWAVNAEIYPLHVMGTAQSIAASSNWIANFAVSEVFKIITSISLVAEIIMYLVLGLFAILTFIFVWYFMTETAGKQIDQILEEILGSGYQEREKEYQRKCQVQNSVDSADAS